MSFRTDLRDAVALAAYEVLRQLGAQVSFDNLNGSPVTLYAEPRRVRTNEDDELGVRVDSTEKEFFIPKQTSFPPDSTDEARYGIVTDAIIAYPVSGGQSYAVTRVEADELGAGFKLICRRRVAKRVGVP